VLAGGLVVAWGLRVVPEAYALPLALAGLLLAAAITANRRGNPLEWRWVHRLGETSYATYLSHFLLWFVFKLVLVSNARDAPLWVLAAYVVTVVAVSELLYVRVERPAQACMHRLAERRRGVVAPRHKEI
jgi:peptidoglycan/LPS O-acetylase OafA/YrhL